MDYDLALAAAIGCIEEEDVSVPMEDAEAVHHHHHEHDGDCCAGQDDGIRNPEALVQHIEQMRLPADFPWAETLVITNNGRIEVNADDDLQREVQFYEFSVNAVKQAINRLDQVGIPYKRPADFFAEMVKSDEHMARIKRKLLHESAAITQVADNKRVAVNKKFAKQVQSQKMQEKALAKRANLDAINTWKKDSGKNKLTADSFDAAMALAEKRVKKETANKRNNAAAAPVANRKRQAKNEKYGSGAKRVKKQNNMAEDDARSKKNSKSKQRAGKRSRTMSQGKSRK